LGSRYCGSWSRWEKVPAKKVADGHVALEVQEGSKNGVKGCRKGGNGYKCPGNERCEVESLAVCCLFRFTLPDRASPVPRCFATIKVPFPPWPRSSLHSILSFILLPLSSAHWWRPADWGGIISHQDCCWHTAVPS
jgi:hypothetical protein